MRTLTLWSFHWVVRQPFLYKILIISAAHWIALMPAISAQRWNCDVGITIELASAITDLCIQKASHFIQGSQWWSMMEWGISNVCDSKSPSGVLTRLSRLAQCDSRGEEGVWNVLEIVSKVPEWDESLCGLRRFVIIWQHHLGCYLARTKVPQHDPRAQICRLNT